MTIGRIPSVEGGIQPTIVDAKGDILTATAADTPAVLAVGNNGETLLADSAATTGLRWNAPVASLANPVINGGMDVWQRGTSITPTIGVATYTADRWQISLPTNVASTISRQATGDTTNLPNIEYCLRNQRNSGQTGTSAVGLVQSFETVNTRPFSGKAVTLSFYARKGADYSATSSALTVYLATGTGTDQNRLTGAYTGDSLSIAGTATLTTTWQRFVVTGTVPTTATEMAVYFSNTPVGTASTNDYYEVTGVQIDVGTYTASTAPTFRRSGGTPAGELAACQRYYIRYNSANASDTVMNYANVGAYSTTIAVGNMPFPVQMRTSPAFSASTASGFRTGFTTLTLTAIAIERASAYSAFLKGTVASGLTVGRFDVIEANANNTSYLEYSSEL